MAQPTTAETKIIQTIIAVLKERPGLDAEYLPNDPTQQTTDNPVFSGLFRIFGEWGSVTLPIFLAWRITPQQAKLLIFQLQSLSDHQPLLLADYVPENFASQLRHHHLDYLDTIGNGAISAAPLFYEVSGKRKKAPKILANRSHQTTGAKILYQLLKDPQLCNQPYRTISQRANVALGAVGPVIKELQSKKLIIEDTRKQRHISHRTALRNLWETAYLGHLRTKIEFERCTLSAPWNIDSLPSLIKQQHLEDHVIIGGELAASFFCENIRPETAALHLKKADALKLMLRLRLTPCDDGPITIVHQTADNMAFKQRSPEGLQLADPRLVRCELLYGEQPEALAIAEAIEKLYLFNDEHEIDHSA